MALVTADPDQLQQVLLNLIQNAVQATPSGGRVAIRARSRGRPPRDRGRGHRRRESRPSICRGSSIRSSPRATRAPVSASSSRMVSCSGTRERSRYRASRGRAPRSGSSFPRIPPERIVAWRRHPILIIDDDETIRHFLSRDLEAEGYQVATADSGETGLRALEKDGADLVLLDIRLPDAQRDRRPAEDSRAMARGDRGHADRRARSRDGRASDAPGRPGLPHQGQADPRRAPPRDRARDRGAAAGP